MGIKDSLPFTLVDLDLTAAIALVSHDLVEIRYVIPTSPKGEQSHFCHLRIDYFDLQLEREAGRLERARQQQAERERKRQRGREVYRQMAAQYEGRSEYECDRLVVRELMSGLLEGRGGRRLSDDEIAKVGRVLLQGPVAQRLKEAQGRDAGIAYAMDVLAKEQKIVERAQNRGWRCSGQLFVTALILKRMISQRG